jgi:hypothetical protein
LGEAAAPADGASCSGPDIEAGSGAGPRIFRFRKGGRAFAVCWTPGPPVEHVFKGRLEAVIDREGREIAGRPQTIIIDRSPKYVDFSE